MKKLLLFVISCAILVSCHQKEVPETPNILWITCEDISPAWGCYGDKQATTPNIDQLASEGYLFIQAFSNAPICSPARSTLITGMYATSLGTQNLRSEIPVPESLRTLPELLRDNGYYTTNNSKTDYNFSAQNRWDENGNKAHWRSRPADKPFFSVFNFGITHEGHSNSNRPEDTESLDQKHNPEEMILPPYFPDTEEFRNIFAHQYDLITVFDQEVGNLIDQLKEDKLFDHTIVFVFSDHGYGLPRYKRWLYNTGLQVPFVLHVPKAYKNRVSNLTKQTIDQMVGFVDFAPTVLNLTGTEIPVLMEGQNFLGQNSIIKEYVFGYRDRADDVYDMSRSVYDGRYLYIRNFMPHKPYIQNAIIFNKGKRSYDELFRLRREGELPDETMKMFMPKDAEELYDLQNDPFELNNLIQDPEHKKIRAKLSDTLKWHLIESHDTGLMNEGDMMVRAGDQSVYEMTRDLDRFDPEKALEAAELVGKTTELSDLNALFYDEDPAVRYWALQALDAHRGEIISQKENLIKLLEDPSVPNQVLAAEILINKFDDKNALKVLENALYEENEPVLLQVAISVRNIEEKAMPLITTIKNDIYPKISGDIWGRYKNWFYPMFIGMALDQTLINCGEEVQVQN